MTTEKTIPTGRDPALGAAAVGLLGLAAAMGIGRFAFTPMLPLMQAEAMLSLVDGGYLAGANYAGYLLGAVLCFALNPRPTAAARLGLAAVAVSTLGMAVTSSLVAWIALRLIAGIASAFVLVGVSAWALAVLATSRRAAWSGWVFAGVGSGIVFASVVALATGTARWPSAVGWLLLGAAASVVAVVAGRSIAGPTVPAETPGPTSRPDSDTARGTGPPDGRRAVPWRPILCYGAFGFGYIIPATFLPAAARTLVDDPAVFGWTWPVFGLAAAISTVVTATALAEVAPRRCWAVAQLVMAAGVALPALSPTLPAIVVSALAVGGTFMVVTMAGMQEARRVGGPSAPRLMAAMTAAFATGQLIGPLTVTAVGPAAEAIRAPSLFAALCLGATALALLRGSGERRP